MPPQVLLAGLLLAGGAGAAPASRPNPCTVVDATLTWGFKESFRSYISGTIANGEWTVADGATYETPDFGWADGVGSYDPRTARGRSGSRARSGSPGTAACSTPRSPTRSCGSLGDGSGVLLLDVVGVTQDGAPIDQEAVEFVELDLADAVDLADGDVTITAAPAVLTPAGATAFGTYAADEPFDPVTATFTLPRRASRPPTAARVIHRARPGSCGS